MLHPSCLVHRLSPRERRAFDTDGFLVIENALACDEIEGLRGASDRIYERKVRHGHDPETSLFYANFLKHDPQTFLALLDHEKVLPKIWAILGWNIYLYHAHLIVTPPDPAATLTNRFGWHQDSGRVNREIEGHPRPRLSVKAAWFLTDTTAPGRGNFWVVPGSHTLDDCPADDPATGQPAGAVPVLVPAGACVLFDRRLWHAASPNVSDQTRKVLFYGYAYRWLRTKDEMTVQSLWDSADPVRRQLLGDGPSANGFYSPTDADVPLRVWLRDHDPDAAE